MKPETTEDILELMCGDVIAAVLGAALELCLFWLLAEAPLPASDVAQSLNIPQNRCHHWLEILSRLGLLENATFLQDHLPAGFDMVMLCDVGAFSEILFRKIYAASNPKGRLVIVDKFAPGRTSAPPSRLSSVFLEALAYPAQSIDFTTTEVVQARLGQAGFRDFSVRPVPHKENLPWNVDWILLGAQN